MKLLYLTSSPYARKVLVCAHEAGLVEDLEIVEIETNPITSSLEANRLNPLGKVPVLLRDDGSALYDSVVICEYFDSLNQGEKLFPERAEERWRALRLHALADGLAEAVIAVRREDNRPSHLHWPEWRDAHIRKVIQTYEVLEAEAADFRPKPDIGQIALATTLEWMEFRTFKPSFRGGFPRLTDWLGKFSERRSMVATTLSVELS